MKELGKNNIFYTLFKDKDEVLLEDAFSLGNRETESEEKNSVWIRNKLTRWKKRGIAEPIYTTAYVPAPYKGARRRLSGIKLTELGKGLLGKSIAQEDTDHIMLTDVIRIVERLQREHPDFEIRLEIKRKNEKKPIVIQ